MFPYLIDVALTAWISSSIVNRYDYNGIERFQNKKKKRLLLLSILLIWVFLFTFRGITGTDAGVYRDGYLNIQRSNLSLSYCLETQRDKLYQILIYFCSKASNGSWVFCCFITSLFIYIPIIVLIDKKSDDFNLSCVLYILSLNAFFGYNGIRQCLSVGFCSLAYYFGLRNKKIIRYILLMALGYGFHAAALLVIPFHLISMKKLKSLTTLFLFIVAFGASTVLVNIWGDIIGLFSGDDLVSKYTEIFVDSNVSSFIRVLIPLAPVVVGLFSYKEAIERFKDIEHDMMMMLFGAVFMLYSMQSAYFSQIVAYFSISGIILWPKVIMSSTIMDKRLLKYIVVFAYFIYMIAALINGDMGINPYIPVWESGKY